MTSAAAVAERAARESYGKLVAFLAARTRDLAAAEDALADAFAAALRAWPDTGIPDNPEAWLFAAARRRLIDGARRAQTATAHAQEQKALMVEMGDDEEPVIDRRLGLLFACAHPAIDVSVRTPLMLQTVLGFSAERIAAAFLAEPTAMGQRLVRAKRKIKDAGIPFDVPNPDEWPERLSAVLDAVYAAYSEGWSDPTGIDATRADLAQEGLWLSEVLVATLPEEPEALGLRALVLHLAARRRARRDATGAYVPLDAQDPALWDDALIRDAEALLFRAVRAGRMGRYQLEAAIQSAHAARAVRGSVDWNAVVMLYDALLAETGSAVVALNRAAALARRDGPRAGLEAIAALAARLSEYQPYWALKAALHAEAGEKLAATAAYDEAIARERDPAVIGFLAQKKAALRNVEPG